MFKKLKKWAETLKLDIITIYFAYTKYKLPWYTKLVALIVIAYALSPIDLIPDFIPILGYLDDIILLPLGIALVVKLIPKDVWESCKEQAKQMDRKKLPKNYFAAALIVLVWVLIAALIIYKIFIS